MHDHPDFPAVQGGMNYGSWNLHLYYLHKNLCALAGKYLVVYIRGAYNRMLFLFTGRWSHILGGGLISGGWGLIIACIFLCTGMDLYLRGGAYK